MFTSQNILLFLSVLLSGMVAGLFYGYSCSVIPGLGNLSNREYLKAFQFINKAILNPYFFTSFMGTLIILPVTAWVNYSKVSDTSFYFLLAATIIYCVGVFGVTAFGNVPLNNSLTHFDINPASELAVSQKREAFEKLWNHYHSIRTIASVLTFSLTVISIIANKTK